MSSLSLTRNIIRTSLLEIKQFQSSWNYSSASYQIEYPKPNLLNSSNSELTVEIIHAKVMKNGSVQQLQVGNYVLNLYVKSQNLGHAQKMFDEIPGRDVRSWTILISGFTRIGLSEMALDVFTEMQKEGISPNQFTFSSILKCCSSVNDVRLGKAIHGWILRDGIGLDMALANSILDLYAKCGVFNYAERLFELLAEKDSVSWNIMIGGCLQIGDTMKSLDLFRRLPFKDVVSWNTVIDGHMRNGLEGIALNLLYEMVEVGPMFNEITFSIALVLAASLSILELGKQLHGRVLRVGIHEDGFVRNSVIDMYCKCGQMEKASVNFRNLPQDFVRTRDSKFSSDESIVKSVSWSSMVSGFVQNGRLEEALKFFCTMVYEQVEMDKFTLTSIVSACANAGLLELGQQIHAHILKTGHKPDVFLGSSMVDMYAKCGKLNDAWLIFIQTKVQNVVLWTSMISSYALHGQGREAISLFELMLNEGITPNEVSFVGVLTACSHAGLEKEGCRYFRLMNEAYGIKPGVEHFTCMVDLFGRAGRFEEIKDFIYKNGISHLSAVWRAFLSSCRVHRKAEMARWVCEKLLELEPFEAGPYILLSNTCATNHKWDEAAKLRALMQERGVKKRPGLSWIQLKNQVHTFVMGDRSHLQEAEIYSYLDKLIEELKEIGYSNDANQVMQDVEEEQKEVILGFHSEKLAVAYGLISTSCGTHLRVMKNLRICTDCHNFMKYTSQLLNREIVVRDIHRFHHFKDGHCSCGDYW
ncbi:putative pentatricopeptide repeat-containing protein At3g23330 [Cornus florida]|uniref:putative pentatricopeptide repeat-containing protein At3g23330 n=1 Tax=Cornus florida TaxID=4283 RepID=UPI0028A0C97A|nr:putative pentatricopeptide repeat-containing protein At3g23330 [Cornus florida]